MDIERIYKRKTTDYLILCAIIVLVFSLINHFTEYNMNRVAFILPPILVAIHIHWWYNYGRKIRDQKVFLLFFLIWCILYAWPIGNIYWVLSIIVSFLVLIFGFSRATSIDESQ